MSKAPELWGREEALVESQHLDMFSRFSKSFAPYWAHVWARPSTGAQTEAMLMLACFIVLTVLTIKIWFKNEKLIFGVRTFIENVRTVFENREKLAHRRCNGDGELPGAEDGAATWCKREAKAWFGVRTCNMPTCTELFKHLQIKRNFNQGEEVLMGAHVFQLRKRHRRKNAPVASRLYSYTPRGNRKFNQKPYTLEIASDSKTSKTLH